MSSRQELNAAEERCFLRGPFWNAISRTTFLSVNGVWHQDTLTDWAPVATKCWIWLVAVSQSLGYLEWLLQVSYCELLQVTAGVWHCSEIQRKERVRRWKSLPRNGSGNVTLDTSSHYWLCLCVCVCVYNSKMQNVVTFCNTESDAWYGL
jgi:hypothetical protein